ncbi:DNA-directed RNA polymerase subunit delta [Candidatus Phytoplasma tritici]|uniref:DNA-directed RNA polymerase subunit delta n=1 Tax=Candidatus Phytoplasma tritici TaxID=321961 RepID=UPI0003F7730C|nr:DNA-directed RNA polymerase subunit delta [Candidatus Phytoplasma tritici]
MKKTKTPKSLLETAYDIMKKHQNPVSVYDLLKQTLQKHQIPNNNPNVANQLYLDITLSGKFVFCEKNQLIIKENNKLFWDKDFFEKTKTANDEPLDEDTNLQELDFEDFLSDKDITQTDPLQDDLLDLEDETSEDKNKDDDKIEDDIVLEDKDDYEDPLEEEYEHLYEK